MKKKILIGSIIAVVILILVSFAGVVGYQTTKSSTIVRASPLFNIRTNRAIDEESKDLTCEYIGIGNTLPFPERDDKSVLTQKVVNRIRLMDDETLERFIAYLINNARKDKRLNDINPDRIRESLYQVRNSNKPVPIFEDDTANTIIPYTACCTINYGIKGILACILFFPLLPFIMFMILFWGNQASPWTLLICPPQPTR
ncbi:MAG: hypothetical protein JSW06_09370 [Thermoplasmatales archaeon]|nr:MAG: hypothetical protein JSW06_09370 [Thermoplasmatales archaeon]